MKISILFVCLGNICRSPMAEYFMKDLVEKELMDEIEAIVFSGTKLNLDYYIEQTLDDDIVEEIYDYFKEEAQSDSLADAMEDLKDDYDEMEVRLVRVKFLCEVAN